MQLEIEQKFPVDDPTALIERIASLGAEELPAVDQEDTYYNHPSRDFANTDEALRIRRTGNTAVLTYKGPKRDTTVKTRPELELPLNKPGDWANLLEALGFCRVAVVRKHRRRFGLSRENFDMELTLDDVTDVGLYAEVEIVAHESRMEPARKVVQDLATDLQLGKPEPRSYLSMLLACRGEG